LTGREGNDSRIEANVEHGHTGAAQFLELQILPFRIKGLDLIGGSGIAGDFVLGNGERLVDENGRDGKCRDDDDKRQEEGGEQRPQAQNGGFNFHDAPALL